MNANHLIDGEGRPWRRSRFALALFNLTVLLAAFLALRLVLFFRFRSEVNPAGVESLKIFLVGWHRDALVALALCLPLYFWLALVPDRWFGRRWHRILVRSGFTLFWGIQIFLLFAEYYFFEEFRSRFNTVAVDYLLYPQEVFTNIWDTYPVLTVLAACSIAVLLLLVISERLFRPCWEATTSGRERLLHLAGACAALVVLWWTQSPQELHLSRDRLLNEIANNGQATFVTAAVTRHLDYGVFYHTLQETNAYQRARRLLKEPGAEFTAGEGSLERRVPGSLLRPRYNVVILLEESFGSEFWGSLGRVGTLTPEMDRLAEQEGLLFTNIYASGNRTVRGFEGVLSSFPPLPGDSIVKRDRSKNVETIARVLKRDGYETVFLYGGRGIFDGMRSFALHNGYDRFIEQKHFEHPICTTTWGVCDEDLFDRALVEFRRLSAAGQPFFATVLTVSNHKPFLYPPGRIPEDPGARQRNHAVKYSDYALGRFFREARREPFYTNTIFVVVADHGARVYGSQSIPIHSYEIPLLIVGPAVVQSPSRIGTLGCSLDVAPTLLGLLGRPYETLFFGRDLLQCPPGDGRVLINHNRDIGLLQRDRLVVLGINKMVEFYHGNPKAEGLQRVNGPDAADLELKEDAIALFQMADQLYIREQFRVKASERVNK